MNRLSMCFGLAETNNGFIKTDNNEISITTDPKQRASLDQVITALAAQLDAYIKQDTLVGIDFFPTLQKKAVQVIRQYGEGSNKVYLLGSLFAVAHARTILGHECTTFKSSSPTKSSIRGEQLIRECPETASIEDIKILSTPRYALINLQCIHSNLKMLCQDILAVQNRLASLNGHTLTYDKRETGAIFCNAKGDRTLLREVETVSRELQDRCSFDTTNLVLRLQKIAGFRGQEGYDSCVAAMEINELTAFLNAMLIEWDGYVEVEQCMREARFESLSFIPKKRYKFLETMFKELRELYRATKELPIEERFEFLGKWATTCLELLDHMIEKDDLNVLKVLSDRVVTLNDTFTLTKKIDAEVISAELAEYKNTAEEIREIDRTYLFVTEMLEKPIPVRDPNNGFDIALPPPRKQRQPNEKKPQASPKPETKSQPPEKPKESQKETQEKAPELEKVVQKIKQLALEPVEISAHLRYLERVFRWFTLQPNPFLTDLDYIGKREEQRPQIIFGHAFAQIVDFFYDMGVKEYKQDSRERRFQVMGDVTQAGKTTYVSFTYTRNRAGYFYHRWLTPPSQDSVLPIDPDYVKSAKEELKVAPLPDITAYQPRTYAKDGSFVINQQKNLVFIADPAHGALIRLVLKS